MVNYISPKDSWSRRQIELPIPADISLITSAYIHEESGMLFLGSNKGEIITFAVDLDNLTAWLLHRCSILNSRAIISFIGAFWSDHIEGILMFVGNRAGSYAIMRLDEQTNSFSELRTSQPPDCRIIGGAYQDPSSGDLFVYGFKGKHFFVRDESNSMEILEEECGGTHRCWAMCPPSPDGGGGFFVWTKASTLGLVHPLPKYRQIVKAGMHGREIKSMVIHGNRIATGAEDTRIAVSRYNSGDSALQLDAFAKVHSSGVHCLEFSECGNFLFSSGGVEELYAWRITDLGTIFESAAPTMQKNPDLRIESFDVCTIHLEENEAAFLVAAVYSDSATRLLVYRPLTKTFLPFLSLPRKTPPVCLTQAKAWLEEDRILLFTGATNGFVSAWDLTERCGAGFSAQNGALYAKNWDVIRDAASIGEHGGAETIPVWATGFHQSSIKNLQIMRDTSRGVGNLIIATAGDDGAVAVGRLCIKKWQCVLGKTTDAHAAAVGALEILQRKDCSDLLFLSFGGDRKIIAWAVAVGGDGKPEFRKVQQWISSVHDISSASHIVASGDEDVATVAVAGVGLEIWKFSLEHS